MRLLRELTSVECLKEFGVTADASARMTEEVQSASILTTRGRPVSSRHSVHFSGDCCIVTNQKGFSSGKQSEIVRAFADLTIPHSCKA